MNVLLRQGVDIISRAHLRHAYPTHVFVLIKARNIDLIIPDHMLDAGVLVGARQGEAGVDEVVAYFFVE